MAKTNEDLMYDMGYNSGYKIGVSDGKEETLAELDPISRRLLDLVPLIGKKVIQHEPHVRNRMMLRVTEVSTTERSGEMQIIVKGQVAGAGNDPFPIVLSRATIFEEVN